VAAPRASEIEICRRTDVGNNCGTLHGWTTAGIPGHSRGAIGHSTCPVPMGNFHPSPRDLTTLGNRSISLLALSRIECWNLGLTRYSSPPASLSGIGVRTRILAIPQPYGCGRTTSAHSAIRLAKLTRIAGDFASNRTENKRHRCHYLYRVCTRLETQPPSTMWVPTELFTPSGHSYTPSPWSTPDAIRDSPGKRVGRKAHSCWEVVGDFA
jgi:hypothetical protein